MTAHEQQAAEDTTGALVCWCCGRLRPAADVVHLGEHPEAVVCLGCAHHLHHVARAREDERSPSPATRARDGLRAIRSVVTQRGWHDRPVIGPLLRWLGALLP
jgi:hypothetical protein